MVVFAASRSMLDEGQALPHGHLGRGDGYDADVMRARCRRGSRCSFRGGRTSRRIVTGTRCEASLAMHALTQNTGVGHTLVDGLCLDTHT